MTGEEWIKLLRHSVEEFNRYRTEHPEEIPDLSGANLYEMDLSGVNFAKADLSGVNLTGANLSGAYLYGVKLHGVHLWRAEGLSREFFEDYIQQLKQCVEFEEVPHKS